MSTLKNYRDKEASLGGVAAWLGGKGALLGTKGANLAMGALALTPPIAGITAGYLAERASAPRDIDFRAAQKDIEVQDYKQAIDDLRQRIAKQRQLRLLREAREQERTLHV